MIRYNGLAGCSSRDFVEPVVTVGVFDGVHLGHRKVLQAMTDWAREVAGNTVVVTFDRHPQAVLRDKQPMFIASLEHRLQQFDFLGIDAAVVLEFNQALAATPPEQFLTETLMGKLGCRRILLGYNAAFGRDGAGTYAFLKELETKHQFEVRRAEPVEVDGKRISSTNIRTEILEGDLQTAAKMLGRPISVLGTVITGSGRGKGLGFPTANLDLHHELRPPAGVYITIVRIGKRLYHSLTNIGYRPTFTSDYAVEKGRELVETHILDFTGDLYGQSIEVSFVEKIREEKKFKDTAALAAQIAQDLKLLHTRLQTPTQ